MTQQIVSAIALPQTSDIHNAVLAVLDGAATQIKRFAAAIHNRCPLVVYIDKGGRTCSQFLARSLFTGYHFTLGNGVAVVTNRETGTQYKVSLNTLYCNCKAFLYSPLPKKPCKHINLVALVLW